MNEKLSQVIPRAIKAFLKNTHTAMPGVIQSYDRTTFRAEVLPGVSQLTGKNKEVEIKPIPDVLVVTLGGVAGLIDIELQRGDPVLLIFSEKGIGSWKSSDGQRQVAPDHLSSHEINDAIAIPCLVPDGQTAVFGKSPRIKIDKDSTITVQNSKGTIKLQATGQVSINDHFTVDP